MADLPQWDWQGHRGASGLRVPATLPWVHCLSRELGARLGRLTGLTGGYRRTLIAYSDLSQREKHILFYFRSEWGCLGDAMVSLEHVTFHLLEL